LVQLGKQISTKRNHIGWTQKELAEKAGISNTTVSRIESGKYNYSLLVLHKLTKALNTQ
jgi:transcriptional regulator with XRE-family HTH domain